jgi:hypothetical protein
MLLIVDWRDVFEPLIRLPKDEDARRVIHHLLRRRWSIFPRDAAFLKYLLLLLLCLFHFFFVKMKLLLV